jgi:D-alanyl-lipoteichoic acid acyltransferase DltB (MBOAT superfamily)
MDLFTERIIEKKKDYKDYLIILGTIIISFIVAFLIISIAGPLYFGVGLAFVAAIAYAGYIIITGRNIEYEYSLTSGDLEITKIISRRKRKRVFFGSCRQFEMLDKVSSERHKLSVNS